MRTYVVLCSSVLVLLLAACSGGSSGKAGSSGSGSGSGGGNATGCPKSCPNDPPYTAADEADCNANTSDPACGAQARALYACISANLTCTAGGTTDDDALMASCGDAKGAWEACQTADAGLE
jgi:hypothetical protein